MAKRSTWIVVGIVALILLVVSGGPWFLFGLPFMALGALGWLFAGLFLLPVILLVAGVIGVGYLAYRARVAREEAPVQELMADPDPTQELSEINHELEALAAESSELLDRTRVTMEKGLRG